MRTLLQVLVSLVAATASFAVPLAMALLSLSMPETPTPEPVVEFSRPILVRLQVPEPEPENRESSPVAGEEPGSASPPTPVASAPPGLETSPIQPSADKSTQPPATAANQPSLPEHVRPDPNKVSQARDTRRRARRRRTCVEPTPGIARTGEYRYELERVLVEHYTTRPRRADQLARTSWHQTDGQVDGFRVQKVRCGSPLHQLGFRNGDVVHAINGRTVTSTLQVLRTFRKLRRQDRLRVQITTRKGQQKVLRFTLI